MGYIARMSVTADDYDAEGVATSEALPESPFVTDKHFQEVGYVIEAIEGVGLVKTVIYFN